ncbi:hypothetical protein EYF80_041281 [Liparis tanakae]|uniref:Uncharacterized protein n=1 Tax=Liparis tanakae TaxID=230148 RepID=A0A4Z2G4N8_9TELE|nr:hypothetical protein EYF80_041281 [Liparis tanakae]
MERRETRRCVRKKRCEETKLQDEQEERRRRRSDQVCAQEQRGSGHSRRRDDSHSTLDPRESELQLLDSPVEREPEMKRVRGNKEMECGTEQICLLFLCPSPSSVRFFSKEDMDLGSRRLLMWLSSSNDATALSIGRKPHDPPPQAALGSQAPAMRAPSASKHKNMFMKARRCHCNSLSTREKEKEGGTTTETGRKRGVRREEEKRKKMRGDSQLTDLARESEREREREGLRSLLTVTCFEEPGPGRKTESSFPEDTPPAGRLFIGQRNLGQAKAGAGRVEQVSRCYPQPHTLHDAHILAATPAEPGKQQHAQEPVCREEERGACSLLLRLHIQRNSVGAYQPCAEEVQPGVTSSGHPIPLPSLWHLRESMDKTLNISFPSPMIHLDGSSTTPQCLYPQTTGQPESLSITGTKGAAFNGCVRGGAGTHLLQTPALGAHKGHTVTIVDIGGDRSHPVSGLGVERVTGHQLRTTERLVDVQTTERVINGHRLQRGRRTI